MADIVIIQLSMLQIQDHMADIELHQVSMRQFQLDNVNMTIDLFDPDMSLQDSLYNQLDHLMNMYQQHMVNMTLVQLVNHSLYDYNNPLDINMRLINRLYLQMFHYQQLNKQLGQLLAEQFQRHNQYIQLHQLMVAQYQVHMTDMRTVLSVMWLYQLDNRYN